VTVQSGSPFWERESLDALIDGVAHLSTQVIEGHEIRATQLLLDSPPVFRGRELLFLPTPLELLLGLRSDPVIPALSKASELSIASAESS
jgi:hypothetical protein